MRSDVQGQRDTRVTAQVAQLPLVVQRADHHLAVLHAHPGGADVRRSVRIKGDDSGHRVRLQQAQGLGAQSLERALIHVSPLSTAEANAVGAGQPVRLPPEQRPDSEAIPQRYRLSSSASGAASR